jgi:chromosome partitioning protein
VAPPDVAGGGPGTPAASDHLHSPEEPAPVLASVAGHQPADPASGIGREDVSPSASALVDAPPSTPGPGAPQQSHLEPGPLSSHAPGVATSIEEELGTSPSEPELSTVPTRASTDRPARPLPRVIAVANQKGGVGKTTTTVNLGASLALFGYRVLVVDLDPQGNATTGLGVDGRGFQHSMYDVLLSDTPMVDCIEPVGVANLFLAPATLDLAGVEQELFSVLSRELRLKRALLTVVDEYDFVFIDCPPSLGLITINAFAAASEILVPVQCEFYALAGLTQLQRIVSLVQRNLNEELEISTVVLTMYDARTRLSEDVANEVRRHFPTQTQGTVIPRTVRLSEAPSFGQPITTFDPASKGARAYKALAREVSDGAQKRAG